MAFDLSDYVDVRQRIEMFKEKYPNGSLQPANLNEPFKVVQIGDRWFIAYTACAYRTPDDPRPGVGCAWEPIPGRTPYTKDSELMNAETSAWGRAIVAVLAVDRGQPIASADEVRNRQQPTDGQVVQMRPEPRPSEKPARVVPAAKPSGGSDREATPKQQAFLRSLATRLEIGDSDLQQIMGCDLESVTMSMAKQTIDNLLAVQKGSAQMVYEADGRISIVPDASGSAT